MLQLLRNHRYF